MDRQYFFFNGGICCWLLALVASFFSLTWAGVFGSLAAGSFLLHSLQWKILTMFKKPNKSAEIAAKKEAIIPTNAPDKTTPHEEQANNTVIARDVCFEGNLKAVGQVYIYGEVQGNIITNEGVVKVMRSGLVNGNITSKELIINGTVKGECKAESMDIGEHANINGALDYVTLSVKKGAMFVGSVETSRKPENAVNVVGIAPTPAVSGKELPNTPEKSKASQA
ncbi:hypothetical protein B1H58_03710 [Pantoea alhagi]|uniref:Ccm protein n=1 Tax=Pantoea alhagi TaxID=1891675 RepID=A0A1W6B2A0_9GAMM|nr:polymer-forming cytoskeletal protein [Pantoea alhagi]ARJ41198.1 hypothetical protein B1H58_03710 [Pantoea alhagi]